MAKKHPTTLMIPFLAYDDSGDLHVTPEDLAEALGNLRYDALALYLKALSDRFQRDSRADGGRGRGKLATTLLSMADDIWGAKLSADHAWSICEPYTKED